MRVVIAPADICIRRGRNRASSRTSFRKRRSSIPATWAGTRLSSTHSRRASIRSPRTWPGRRRVIDASYDRDVNVSSRPSLKRGQERANGLLVCFGKILSESMAAVFDHVETGRVMLLHEIALLFQHVDESRRIAHQLVDDRLQLRHDFRLPHGLEPRRIALGEIEIVDEFLVQEGADHADARSLWNAQSADLCQWTLLLPIPGSDASIDDDVAVGDSDLRAALTRMQQIVHRTLVDLEAAFDGWIVRSARRLFGFEPALRIDIACAEEFV